LSLARRSKGIIAGIAIGFFARKVHSLALGILFGLAVGFVLAFIVAQLQHGYYLEIILPGSIVGIIVATRLNAMEPRPPACRHPRARANKFSTKTAGFAPQEKNYARIVHFEIPADDPQRAAAFYKKAFGWKIEKWPGPMEYWMVTTGPMARRESTAA